MKCYMCESDATSQEHVPPKCLFPAEKDLPKGVSLRQNLITVPSCDNHNTVKSHDDEFFLFCLCMNIAGNSIAFMQFTTKVMRAYRRRPALMNTILKESKSAVAVDENGVAHNTSMVKVDGNRINKCCDQIARALYFYEFRTQFVGHCRFVHDWLIEPESKKNSQISDAGEEKSVLNVVKDYFRKIDHAGSNPEVFKYHFDEPNERGVVALSMQFYGGTNIFIALIPSA